jgi:adenine-specific DNA-methyltransferase
MTNEEAMTNPEPEKLDLRSHDIAEDKRHELLRLFPEIRAEGGKLDFERLKLALGEAVDVGKERYGMNWPGKAECFHAIQAPSLGTLRPCPEESANFDTTENLIIEGDNLEVLKLLPEQLRHALQSASLSGQLRYCHPSRGDVSNMYHGARCQAWQRQR